jgi:ribosomal protein S27AE
MARALTERARVNQLQNRAVASAVLHKTMCTRCGGLMVNDFCTDLLNSTGDLEFAAKRCVQCGEVVDPVILRNRGLRQDSMTVRPAGRVCPNNCVTEVP